MQDTLPRRLRLGVYIVDLRVGEIRGGKGAVVLPEQPFQILRMLIEAGGELVSRDQIQKKLWPNDTVVEFDHSINAAVNKLRQALGDSAGAPQYIETIPRRGYRLLVAVEPVPFLPNGTLNESNSDAGATPAEPMPASIWTQGTNLIGKKVSHYRVLNIIGGGGMGLVYEAEDLKLGRRVALKFLPEDLAEDSAALQRFEREARAASSLDHPNICTIHEVEEHEGQPFIVMQLLRGETLRDRLAALQLAQQSLSPSELTNIAVQICDGLAAAHANGIIHRDIKPANIFLTNHGQAKILDFGLAKLVEAEERNEEAMAAAASGATGPATSHDLTILGLTMGTAGYMSPEQVRGEKLDARTDLFSFGLVMYEMATGHRAFIGETAAMVKDAILHQSPVPVRERNADVPLRLEGIINRAIAKDKEKRCQNAEEIRADLLAVADDDFNPGLSETGVRSSWIWLATAAALICALLIFAGLSYWRSHRPPKLTQQDTIVVADFENETGDPIFDETLKQGLAIQLGQSPFINVLSDRKVRDTLKLMKRPASDPLNESVGREVCLRSNSKAMLVGYIVKSGAQYAINVKAVDCSVGETIAEVQETAANKDSVLKALDKTALAMRTKLGESLSSVERYATPLSQATTSSLEALKAFTLADKIQRLQGPTASLPILKRALEIDPNFAAGYQHLGTSYRNLGEGKRAEECFRKAFELRDRVSERERFMIESTYYSYVTREIDKAAQVYEDWYHTYPKDYAALANLGVIYSAVGENLKALETGRTMVKAEPNYGIAYQNLGAYYENLNRLEEAEEVFKEAERRGLSAEYLLENHYELAFLKGDQTAMARMLASAKGKPGTEDVLVAAEADTQAWYGKFKSARKLTEDAVASATKNDARETAAVYFGAASLREAAAGNHQLAIRGAKIALGLSQQRDVKAVAALAMAQSDEVATASTLAAGLNQEYPLDTVMQQYWLPTINAAIALKHDPEGAVRALADVGKLENGAISPAFNVFLCPAYVRGEAYLRLANGPAAAAEFQKFIDNYGLITNFPWGALARLQLARAYALEAQTDPAARDKAIAAYENFLTLWKDADPDVPIYRQAKAEYANLR